MVVFAQGPIGLCATVGARLMGASLVIGVDGDEARLAMARKLGVDVVLDFRQQDVVAEVKRLTGGGVDVAIEALGTQQTFESALRTLQPGGTLSSLGVYSGKLQLPYDAFAAGLGDHRIVTTLCPGGKERMRRLMELVRAKRVDLTPLLTHRFALEGHPRRLRALQPAQGRRAQGRHPSVKGRARAPAGGLMLKPFEVHIQAEPLTRFERELDAAGLERAPGAAPRGPGPAWRAARFWNVNSTARGGGVAEMLPWLLAYARGAGVDARWLVLDGHARSSSTSPSGCTTRCMARAGMARRWAPAERAVLRRGAPRQRGGAARPGAPGRRGAAARPADGGAGARAGRGGGPRGLALPRGPRHAQRRGGAGVGVPRAGPRRRAAHRLHPRRLRAARSAPDRAVVIQPSIDIFAVKNQPLAPEVVRAILAHTGLLRGAPDAPEPAFTRADGVPARVSRGADIVRLGAAPAPDTPLVVQVSRWDPLKDPAGVLRGLRAAAAQSPGLRAELVLAGPAVTSVADDPEAAATLEDVIAAVAAAAPLRAPARPPGVPAHGGPGGERRHRQRAPAPRGRGGAEEPAGGLRAHRHRGHVEGPPRGGERGGRHPGPDASTG